MERLGPLFELVRSVEMEIFLTEEDQPEVRLEIWRAVDAPDQFRWRFWRLELYQLQSTLPQVDGRPAHGPSTELILKEWESIPEPSRTFTATGDADALAQALEYLKTWLRTLEE